MKYTAYGQLYCSTDDLCNLLYENADLNLENFEVGDPDLYNTAVKHFYADLPKLKRFNPIDYGSIENFDQHNQSAWYMPQEYQQLDIAQHVLNLCKSDAELQRAAAELFEFQDKGLFDLLKFMKYLVDTMRKHKIVWGVGRGSSVSSFVLYLMGVVNMALEQDSQHQYL
jgi:DNA polymerase III alpha subunit